VGRAEEELSLKKIAKFSELIFVVDPN